MPMLVVSSLVAVAMVLTSAWSSRAIWFAWFASTVTSWSDLLTYPALLFAGISAWMLVPLRTRMGREQTRLAARSPWELVRAGVVGPCLAAILAMSVSLTIMIAASIVGGAVTTTHVVLTMALWWIGTLGAMCAFVTVGALVGWLIGHDVAVVVAPAVVYLLILVPVYTVNPPPWDVLYAVVAETWSEQTATLLGAAARSVLWSALASAGLLLLAKRLRAAWIAALVASLGVTMGMLDGGRRVPIDGAADVVCQQGRPTVCTRGAFQPGLPRAAAILSEGLRPLPDSLAPQVIGSDPEAHPPGVALDLEFSVSGQTVMPTNLPNRQESLAGLGRAVLDTCRNGASLEQTSAQLAVESWWRSTLGLANDRPVGDLDDPPYLRYEYDPNVDADAVRAKATGLSLITPAQREQWLDAHAAEIRACRLDLSDLP